MPTISRRQFAAFTAGALAAPLSHRAVAQARPELARILVPFPAGGTTDVVARLVAEQLRGDLATSVVVENRTGAAGRLAIQGLLQAPPDGLTLMVHAGGIQSLYPLVLKQPGYDAWTDVAPISNLCQIETALIVGPSVPATVKTLQDWLNWARVEPRNGTFGSAGAGTPMHLIGVVLGQQAKVELTPIHYRSGSLAMPDLLGGQVPALSVTLNDAIAQLPTGKVRILATSGSKRSPLVPDVPTLAELGHPQLTNVDHFKVFVHGKTPAALQERLSGKVRQALLHPNVTSGFRKLFVEAEGSTPADSLRLARTTYESNARMVKAVGYQPE